MADLEIYDVVVNGYATQMQLSKADAERYGATKSDAAKSEKRAPAARNKARSAANKSRGNSGDDASAESPSEALVDDAHEGEAGAE